MAQEWFSVGELRATRLEFFNGGKLLRLVEAFAGLSVQRARTRVRLREPDEVIFEAEFHISLFPKRVQDALRLVFPTDGEEIRRRQMKLGIHRTVFDPRSSYVGPDVDDEIAELERLLAKLKARKEGRAKERRAA